MDPMFGVILLALVLIVAGGIAIKCEQHQQPKRKR